MPRQVDTEGTESISSDELQLVNSVTLEPRWDGDSLQDDHQKLGYKQTLHRSWHFIESFAASFAALDFINGVRAVFFLGIYAGGPAAMWSSYLITCVFMWITAAVLAEICSALPVSGSIYTWAAESAGPKYARFFGFIVAFWSSTAWSTFAASNCQTTANYIVSQLAVWEIDFPGGIDNNNVNWRALIWAISEGLLILSVAMNYLHPKWFSWIFKFSVAWALFDFLLMVIWLPIGVSRSYGFRSASDVFTLYFNGTGAPDGWNWILSFYVASGTLVGFDASGHIAEETKNASITSARGIFWSAIATGILGFLTTILFLFCTPDFDTLFALGAPQPFVQIFALAFGPGASIFPTIVATIGLILNTTCAIVASSRLIFAIARDGVLPGSDWLGKVDENGQPKNAVTFIFIFAALLLCTILPSNVAFTSLVSAAGIPTVAAYGLIAALRLFLTPNDFKISKFNLGRWAKPFYICAIFFNAIVFATNCSPFFFPVTDTSEINYSPIIFGAITLLALSAWWVTPADKWYSRSQATQLFESADGEDVMPKAQGIN